MKETAQDGADAAALGGTSAAILYGGVGLIDAASRFVSASQLALAALLYAAVGIVASAALLGCIRVIRGLRRKPLRASYEGSIAALWAGIGLLTGYVVVRLNLYVLLDYPWFSAVSIGTTLVFCASAGLLIMRFAVRRLKSVARRMPPVLAWTVRLCPLLIRATAVASFGSQEHTFCTRSRKPANLPNGVVLVSDCVRADHVSDYGYEHETTPLFDRCRARFSGEYRRARSSSLNRA